MDAPGPQDTPDVQQAIRLAGFFAAHAVWSISEGALLVPILAFEKDDGQRQMIRLAVDKLEKAVEYGQDWLEKNPEGAARAVLIFDALITLQNRKTDALIVNCRAYGPPTLVFDADGAGGSGGSSGNEPTIERPVRSIVLAIPYRSASSPEGFAVHRPKFLSADDFEPDFDALGEAFFQGVDAHEKGSAIWNAHLDPSR